MSSTGFTVFPIEKADHLVAITAPGLIWSASDDGDGVRLAQLVNGVSFTYPASHLPSSRNWIKSSL